MTSLTVPVIANNQFRGVVGTDLNLPIIQKRAETLKRRFTTVMQKFM